MLSELVPVLPELLEVSLFGAVTTVLGLGGLYLERFAYLSILGGDTGIGVWGAVAGFVLCGFAYLMATDKFRPSLRQLRAAMAEGD